MKLNDLNYKLPESLIAQYPIKKREDCRLLVYSRDKDKISHLKFNNILNYIEKNDIIIFNDTKVFPARLQGVKKRTGAKIEIFLLEKKSKSLWKALIKPAKRIKGPTDIILNKNITIKVMEQNEKGHFFIEFNREVNFKDLEKIGETPLPPYIRRTINKKIDKKYYQTVYAKNFGAAAAPTAGFHFSRALIRRLKKKGIKIGFLTLHISYATFAPIRTENIEDHKMHSEYLIVPQRTVDLINNNKKGKIIAIGTTVVRSLESLADQNRKITKFQGWINTYIYPGYRFKITDSLITNFHLPKSTLLLLVGAFTGLDKLLEIYREAIKNKYRFFSYGDAMYIQ